MGRKLTNEEFIQQCKQIHCDKYDYSKTHYVNSHSLITVICPEHGEFQQYAYVHKQNHGCPYCAGNIRSDSEDFIKKAKQIHGDKYNYDKVNYKQALEKVIITCPIHGDFEQTPASHLKGRGCPICGIIKKSGDLAYTSEEFINLAKQIHKDKYDYSKVNYINNKTKVCIICPEHGEFWQTPANHLCGKGCSKCAKKYKITLDEFIKKAIEIHGNKYDYSKVNFINMHTKVTIICPIHGEFEQTPDSHINRKCGCPKCKGFNKTTEDVISEFRKIHGNKYNYDKFIYTKRNSKGIITCPIHGDFEQIVGDHLKGHGCPKCKSDLARSTADTKEEFISKAIKLYGNKYDYSLVEYVNSQTKVKIICPIHGIFEQKPYSHLQGHECPKCYYDSEYLTKEEFILKANKIHKNKYDYSKVKYINSKTPVIIICPKHGEFIQSPNSHLDGHGCPSCNYSKGESFVQNILTQYKIPYKGQFTLINDYFQNNILRIDFFIKYKGNQYFIEYNGIQHYSPIEHFGGEKQFIKQTKRDQMLRDFCELHKDKIQLLEIKYDEPLDKTLENKILNFIKYEDIN